MLSVRTTALRIASIGCLAIVIGFDGSAASAAKSETFSVKVTTEEPMVSVNSVLDFSMNDIDGNELDLSEFGGVALLVVNAASECGLTPQYEGLQTLYEKYRDQGFSILGFPANEFGKQEPGTDEEIKTFCTTNYSVTFPMFSKIVVKGEGIHPLYEYLTEQQPTEELRGEIEWNFTKFLIGRDGQILARFEPPIKPEDADLVAAVESALQASAAE